MSDLFYTGRARQTSGAFSVTVKGGSELAKKLRKLEAGGTNAIKRTVSDFSTRAPAWVSKGIREHYAVDTVAIKEAGPQKKRGKTTVQVAGKTVDGVALQYSGRTLTLTHFKLSPKSRPTALKAKLIRIPGQNIAGAGDVAMIRPPKKYKVKTTIIKGQRITLPGDTFIASGNGGSTLPFQRTGEGRMPIETIRTLSVPQMIDGRARETIEETIGEQLGKRFENHIKQAMK